jgi:uncharacterized protein YbaP (TraB family)
MHSLTFKDNAPFYIYIMKYLLSLLLLVFSLTSTAQYKGLLWKISGNGLSKPSYLYGTMHTANARAYNFSPEVMKSLNAADAFAMELLIDSSMLDISLVSMLMMTDGTTLDQLFTKKEYAVLDSMVQNSFGYPLSLFNTIQPVIFMALLEDKAASADSSRDFPLDLYFLEEAKKLNKRTIGIESLAEQMKALQTLNYKEQAELISRELKKNKNSDSYFNLMISLYERGELDSLSLMNKKDPMPRKMEKALLGDRNIRMADRIELIIKAQSAFIAIGALHLPAKDGVIELLRKKGFTVTAI